MAVTAGPFTLVQNIARTVQAPNGSGGQQAWKYVVLFNYSPFLLTVEYGNSLGFLQPFFADVFPMPANGLPPTVVPASIGITSPSASLSAVFYDADDGVPGGLPIPLSSPAVAGNVILLDPNLSAAPPLVPDAYTQIRLSTSPQTVLNGKPGQSIYIFHWGCRLTVTNAAALSWATLEIGDGTSSVDGLYQHNAVGTGFAGFYEFASTNGDPLRLGTGLNAVIFIPGEANLSFFDFFVNYAYGP